MQQAMQCSANYEGRGNKNKLIFPFKKYMLTFRTYPTKENSRNGIIHLCSGIRMPILNEKKI